jgi:hypothetical protein
LAEARRWESGESWIEEANSEVAAETMAETSEELGMVDGSGDEVLEEGSEE